MNPSSFMGQKLH